MSASQHQRRGEFHLCKTEEKNTFMLSIKQYCKRWLQVEENLNNHHKNDAVKQEIVYKVQHVYSSSAILLLLSVTVYCIVQEVSPVPLQIGSNGFMSIMIYTQFNLRTATDCAHCCSANTTASLYHSLNSECMCN